MLESDCVVLLGEKQKCQPYGVITGKLGKISFWNHVCLLKKKNLIAIHLGDMLMDK